MADLTVEDFCNYVAGGVWDRDDLLCWPPDVFAIVAALLLKSGGYAHAVCDWKRSVNLPVWSAEMRDIGDAWRATPEQPPAKVSEWHRTMIEQKSVPIFAMCEHHDLCGALLQLSAAADEACRGVGCTVPSPAPEDGLIVADHDPREEAWSAFRERASFQLLKTNLQLGLSTLCERINHSTVRVLPKLHTPQSGITIRSMTHNLALCPAGDVKPKWAECLSTKRHCLNILLAPWPLQVTPAHFQTVDPGRAVLPDIADGFGFFEYSPADVKPPAKGWGLLHQPDDPLFDRLKQMLENAKRVVPQIDGVIFPELALTPAQYQRISNALMSEDPGIFLICGVRDGPNDTRKAGQNYLRFDIPFVSNPKAGEMRQPMSQRQDKHHRWRMDKRQIVQYGLGSSMDVAKKWWEHISIESRELYFVVLDDWLTICPLICEDLARQDPISELVRSVGPNLVIALLMDGPQLPSRWPARYATVLADDPGSSVLTLTSAGMAELCRPPNINTTSRAIALWKDAKTGEAISIELPPKMEGVVLSLSRQYVKEWSADGRNDGGSTGYPTLSGIHYVSSDLSK